ncbi:MAG: sigma-70 family RNA polymerase sigma factor, partial [Planctomycetia bacterium]|nr:sigma-70 family RNA polymerase sigma factor [Planctomycetia bacterium]
ASPTLEHPAMPHKIQPSPRQLVVNSPTDSGEDPENEEVARAVAALDALPPRQREVLYLFACEGLNLTEIAGVLKCKHDAVKMNLSLARKKMRSMFTETPHNTCDARAST